MIAIQLHRQSALIINHRKLIKENKYLQFIHYELWIQVVAIKMDVVWSKLSMEYVIAIKFRK